MTVQKRIEILIQLGKYLQKKDERLYAFLHRTAHNNRWFTIEEQYKAIDLICKYLLDENKLKKWVENRNIPQHKMPQNVGILPHDHSPLSAWNIIMTTFIYGHISVIKLPKNDSFLLPFLIKKMEENYGGVKDFFKFKEQLPVKELDGLLAQVTSNMRPHLERYFQNKPTYFQEIKHSLSVIHGTETREDFLALSKDVLTFFGRDERNVSKLYVPKNYDFNLLLETFHEKNDIIKHDPYKNNYDYQISLLILNRTLHWNNGSIILAEQSDLQSPIAVLNFESYENHDDLINKLNTEKNNIKNIVSQVDIKGFSTIPFGSSLNPTYFDFEF